MEDLRDKTMGAALKILNRRPLSCRHLYDKLVEKGHAEEAAARTIARLQELKLLDDEAYGQALIREMTRGKPAGSRLLRQKLSLKGLDRQTVDQLIEAFEPDRDQLAAFAAKQWRAMRETDERKKKQKLWALLGRRGFSGDAIEDAMSRLGQDDLE